MRIVEGAAGATPTVSRQARLSRKDLLEGEVWVWCIPLHGNPYLAELASTLFVSADERMRAEAFRLPSLRADYAVSRGILRVLLAGVCDCAPANVSLIDGAHGKPHLANDSLVQFNVTHSGGFAAYALTLGHEIGIDIEARRAMPDLERLARLFFSAEEYRELMDLDAQERVGAFFDCWVRKEAYVKSIGGGLSIPLDSFRVSLAPGRPAALIRVRNDADEAKAWSLRAFSPAIGYHGAVAVRARNASVRIQFVPPESFV